ncbi:MAG: hypothetical protein FJZ56_05370 [Chlamydiae bacterium]|nr:hypothetical protein [Chlamydiota bacterium]
MAKKLFNEVSFKRQDGPFFDQRIAKFFLSRIDDEFHFDDQANNRIESGYLCLIHTKDRKPKPIFITLKEDEKSRKLDIGFRNLKKEIYIEELDLHVDVDYRAWNTYTKTPKDLNISLSSHILKKVALMIQTHPHREIYVTGHGFGASLALLLTLDLAMKYPKNTIICCTFGSLDKIDPRFLNIFEYLSQQPVRKFVYWGVQNSIERFKEELNIDKALMAVPVEKTIKIAVAGDEWQPIIKRKGRSYRVETLTEDTSQALKMAEELDGMVFCISTEKHINTEVIQKLFLAKVAGISQIIIVITNIEGVDPFLVEYREMQIEDWLRKIGFDPKKVGFIRLKESKSLNNSVLNLMDLRVIGKAQEQKKQLFKHSWFKGAVKAVLQPLKNKNYEIQLPSTKGMLKKSTFINTSKNVALSSNSSFLILEQGQIIGIGEIKRARFWIF